MKFLSPLRKFANVFPLTEVDELAAYSVPVDNIAVSSEIEFDHHMLLIVHSFPFSSHEYTDFVVRENKVSPILIDKEKLFISLTYLTANRLLVENYFM